MNRMRLAWVALGLAFSLSGPLKGQVNTGTIEGIVTDSSDAAVPNVRITATNQDTGFSRSTQTTASGTYLIPQLPIGPNYQITGELSGFKTSIRSGVALELKQNVRVDLQLQVGATTQNVEVKSQAPLVDTQSASGGEVVGSERLVELPLNGRNPIQLAGLVTGVTDLSAVTTLSAGNRSAIHPRIIKGT